jgi:hypothetical protein
MQRSIVLIVLALGAPAVWAQDATDVTGDEAIVEATNETAAPTPDAGTDTSTGTGTETVPGVTEEETDVVEDEDDGDGAIDDEAEVVEDEIGVEGDETEVSDEGDAVRTDSRSARGAFRGGHHGQVSTLARAGLGPVFGKLRSQGYGDIAIEQVGNAITISAARPGETRQLVYDASTGALLSDVAGPSSDGILGAFSSTPKKQSAVSSKRERKGPDADDAGSEDRSNSKGGGNGNGNGGSNGNGGGKGNGNGGGNGKNR